MAPSQHIADRFPSLRRLVLKASRRRVPVVRQSAIADCGAAALAMVLLYFGKEVSVKELKAALGIGRGGTSLAALLRTARSYGLRGRGVRVDVTELEILPTSTILYWESRHFVVLEKTEIGYIHIVDPAWGRRAVPLEKARASFSGVALLFEPAERFEPGKLAASGLRDLLLLVLAHKDVVAKLLPISVLIQFFMASMPLFTGVLIDRVIPHQDYSLLSILAIGYGFAQVFSVAASFIRDHLFIFLRTRLEAQLSLRFLDHLIDLPYSFFLDHTSGDLMMRLSITNTVKDILTSAVLSTFMDGLMASFYLLLLSITNWYLTLIVALLCTLRVVLLLTVRLRQRHILSDSLENQARSQSYQVEMLSGMETLKAMGLEHRAAETWSNIFVDGLNISIRRGRLQALFNAGLGLLGTMSTLTLMFYGSLLVMRGVFSVGAMMAFGALATAFLSPFNNLLSSAVQVQLLEVYVERLNEVFDTTPEPVNSRTVLPEPFTGSVHLENVSFVYGSQEPHVIGDVSFDIDAYTRVAIVGKTGSGKSTLARIIGGLYEPTKGRLSYDGMDSSRVDRRAIRRRVGIVTQDVQLFSGSIRHNIALADPRMAMDRVIAAATTACIHEDIVKMPMGYDTPLADRGLSLSGGQRQRLAIARALVNMPSILILDEATSHLDTVTEAEVSRQLMSLRCTTIVIAHRLSTIKNADLIIVLDGGMISEKGSHDSLMKHRGIYAELISEQLMT